MLMMEVARGVNHFCRHTGKQRVYVKKSMYIQVCIHHIYHMSKCICICTYMCILAVGVIPKNRCSYIFAQHQTRGTRNWAISHDVKPSKVLKACSLSASAPLSSQQSPRMFNTSIVRSILEQLHEYMALPVRLQIKDHFSKLASCGVSLPTTTNGCVRDRAAILWGTIGLRPMVLGRYERHGMYP